MAIVPYQQTLTHSCLAACFLMLQEKNFTEIDEKELAMNGSSRKYPFYMVGISAEFIKKYDGKITIYADNNFFTATLQKGITGDKKINVIHKKIDMHLISKLLKKKSIICHIDDHALGDFSHASHFIILEKESEKFITIIDPWNGKKYKISKTKLTEAISDLKNHIKMCPLLFSIET